MMIDVSPWMAMLVALLGLSAVVAEAQTDTPLDNTDRTAAKAATAPPTLKDPWSAVTPTPPEHDSRTVHRRSQTETSPPMAGAPGPAQHSTARTLGALAGVVGLIVLLAWGYRAAAGGRLTLLNKVRRPGLIELVSRTSLSARQSLCLVRVGPRLVLIGQSPDQLRTLDVIDDADLAARLIGEAARKRADSSAAEFHECLEREASGYQVDDGPPDANVFPGRARLADVRKGWTDTIQRIRRAVAQV
jgi:flagellar biogenesis protein FliO